jgi:hypothetical protein
MENFVLSLLVTVILILNGEKMMEDTTTHVAGPVIIVPDHRSKTDRMIQRCVVCGHKLVDSLGQMVVVSEGEEVGSACHFGERRYIRITEGNPQRLEDVGCFIHDDQPQDFCLSLVE